MSYILCSFAVQQVWLVKGGPFPVSTLWTPAFHRLEPDSVDGPAVASNGRLAEVCLILLEIDYGLGLATSAFRFFVY